jgi:hypothetical protein
MRAYRTAWHVTLVVLTALALVAGADEFGWAAILGAAVGLSVMGAVFGYSLVEDRSRRARATVLFAMWFGVGTVLVLGLPVVLGDWSLLVMAAAGALCPPAVGLAVGWVRRRSGDALDQTMLSATATTSLQSRWSRTSQELREHHADAAEVLALVDERSRLLDELEASDPAGFQALLARSGWCEPRDR